MKYSSMARLMKRAHLKSADVERLCSVSRQTVHNWRTGKHDPQIEHVAVLSAELARRGVKAQLTDFFGSKRRAA